jgi:hypothetical protein
LRANSFLKNKQIFPNKYIKEANATIIWYIANPIPYISESNRKNPLTNPESKKSREIIVPVIPKTIIPIDLFFTIAPFQMNLADLRAMSIFAGELV